jgi:hypothetical protein
MFRQPQKDPALRPNAEQLFNHPYIIPSTCHTAHCCCCCCCCCCCTFGPHHTAYAHMLTAERPSAAPQCRPAVRASLHRSSAQQRAAAAAAAHCRPGHKAAARGGQARLGARRRLCGEQRGLIFKLKIIVLIDDKYLSTKPASWWRR